MAAPSRVSHEPSHVNICSGFTDTPEHSQQRLPDISSPLINLMSLSRRRGSSNPPTKVSNPAIRCHNVTGRSHPWPSQPQPRSSPAAHQPRSVSPPVSLLCLLPPPLFFSHDVMRIQEFRRDSAAHRAASPTTLCSRLPNPTPASPSPASKLPESELSLPVLSLETTHSCLTIFVQPPACLGC